MPHASSKLNKAIELEKIIIEREGRSPMTRCETPFKPMFPNNDYPELDIVDDHLEVYIEDQKDLKNPRFKEFLRQAIVESQNQLISLALKLEEEDYEKTRAEAKEELCDYLKEL